VINTRSFVSILACALLSAYSFATAQATQGPAPAPAGSPGSPNSPDTPPTSKPPVKPRTKSKAKATATTAKKVHRSAAKPVDYSKLVELNSASKEQLMTLPGVDAAAAARIIAGRPYVSKTNIETHHILPPGSYAALRARIFVVPPVAKTKP
jgi:hypothetical protein